MADSNEPTSSAPADAEPAAGGRRANRRSWRSYWVRPAMQMRFFLHALGVTLLALGLGVGAAVLRILRVQSAALEDPWIAASQAESMSALAATISLAMALFGGLLLLVTAIYAHRVAGPMVPLERALDAMISGDYSFRIRLRKNDEFQALASKINRLAESLDGGSSRK